MATADVASHPKVQSDWIEPRHACANTETFTLTTAYPANTQPGTARGSHGLSLLGNKVRIVHLVNGRCVAVGERGETAVKGPTLMLGYLGTPLDEALDEDAYLRTR